MQVKAGSIYTGLFHTANVANKDLDIVLKFARLVENGSSGKGQHVHPVLRTLKVFSSDWVKVEALGVGLEPGDLAPTTVREGESFTTDAEIGRGRSGWAPLDTTCLGDR